MELKDQFDQLIAEQKTFKEKFVEEMKSYGAASTATRDALEKLQKQVDAIDVKMAERAAAPTEQKSLVDVLKESEDVSRIIRNHKGQAVITLSGKQLADIFERKTTITSTAVGAMTTGVLQIDRIPGITPEARQALTIRNLLTARPTTMQVVDFVKVNSPLVKASPQVEASDKYENAVTFTSVSEKVKTLATWIPAARQILDDFTELASFLNSGLPYYTNLEEEVQLLSGDGDGENLNGLVTQGTAFDATLLSASKGWNKMDIVGRAVQQITTAKEIQPTFVVMTPADWWDIRLTKDSYGRYVLGDPQTPVRPSLFGLDVVPTTSITASTFLVGSGLPVAAEIRDRMEMQVEISTEHSDYFTKNLVAIRAEKRLALVVKRPASFIHGTFSNSPA